MVGVVASVLESPEGLGGSDPLDRTCRWSTCRRRRSTTRRSCSSTPGSNRAGWCARTVPVEETAAAHAAGALRGRPEAAVRVLPAARRGGRGGARLPTLPDDPGGRAGRRWRRCWRPWGIHGLVAQHRCASARGEPRHPARARVDAGPGRSPPSPCPEWCWRRPGWSSASALALASSRLLSHFVWGVSATDPAVLAIGAGALVLLAGAASLVPGLRVLEPRPGADPARGVGVGTIGRMHGIERPGGPERGPG